MKVAHSSLCCPNSMAELKEVCVMEMSESRRLIIFIAMRFLKHHCVVEVYHVLDHLKFLVSHHWVSSDEEGSGVPRRGIELRWLPHQLHRWWSPVAKATE